MTEEDLSDDLPETAGDSGQDELIGELQKQLEDARSSALYAAAEAQNVRRRLEAEKVQASTYAVANFARDMLSVKDNLDRALAAVTEELRADTTAANFLAGIEATSRELDAIFTRNGVTRIAARGMPLDPNKHQAMIEMPSDQEPGTVIEEMQAGYMLKERLLRPALVGVARAG